MFSTVGEDDATPDAIRRTGGVVTDEHWEEKLELAKAAAATAKAMGLSQVSILLDLRIQQLVCCGLLGAFSLDMVCHEDTHHNTRDQYDNHQERPTAYASTVRFAH